MKHFKSCFLTLFFFYRAHLLLILLLGEVLINLGYDPVLQETHRAEKGDRRLHKLYCTTSRANSGLVLEEQEF